jgi:hypothetical protein
LIGCYKESRLSKILTRREDFKILLQYKETRKIREREREFKNNNTTVYSKITGVIPLQNQSQIQGNFTDKTIKVIQGDSR